MCHNSKRSMICKNDLYDLLDESFSYVICNDNGDKLEELFDRTIEENKDNFVVFKNELEIIKDVLKEDLQFFMDSDPAASSLDEIKMAYPGFKAIAIYRISHVLYKLGYTVHARYFSELAHSQTGIDIRVRCHSTGIVTIILQHGKGIVLVLNTLAIAWTIRWDIVAINLFRNVAWTSQHQIIVLLLTRTTHL